MDEFDPARMPVHISDPVDGVMAELFDRMNANLDAIAAERDELPVEVTS